jgi:hypothetical protein
MKDRWWSPDPRELQIEEGEKDYFLELLMGGSVLGGGRGAVRGQQQDEPASQERSSPGG